MIPRFNQHGVLPGDCRATIDEILASHLVTGNGVPSRTWDVAKRRMLVENLRVVTDMFWRAGVSELFVDGSFVEAKDSPGDIDAYFPLDKDKPWELATLSGKLNAMDADPVWTWDPRALVYVPKGTKRELKYPFWVKYKVEVFSDTGGPTGISDRTGRDLPFAQAFRQQRDTFRRKGIIQLTPPKGRP